MTNGFIRTLTERTPFEAASSEIVLLASDARDGQKESESYGIGAHTTVLVGFAHTTGDRNGCHANLLAFCSVAVRRWCVLWETFRC